MKRIILSFLCALPCLVFGQVLMYNDGAMLKIEAGATLFVEGGIQNTASGTIDNDGIIEVQGDFINAGTWEASNPNTLKFSGNNDANVTSGSALFDSVVIAKGSGGDLTLTTNGMTINRSLNWIGTNNKIFLGGFDLNMGATATTIGYDVDEYVVTNGTGKMKKTYNANGAFEFPVGFNATTYNQAEINKTAGPNETFGVRVLGSPTDGNGLTGTPFTSDVVDAVWDISENTAGGNTANIKLGWQESDELAGFDDLLNTVSRNDGTNGWEGLFADLGPEVGNTRTKNGYTGFGAFAVGDKPLANEIVLSPKVFLQGPYVAADDKMSDGLRTGGHLPLLEPYTAAPYSYAQVGYGGGESVPSTATFNQPLDADDIVDWIIVEIRDASTPATKLATRTALIQRDGDIVDLDGASPLKVSGLTDGTYHVGLKHRNHLPIRTQTALVLGATATVLNFTVDDYAYDNGSTNNEPTATVEAGVEAMWGGDADLNNQIAYGTGDRLAVLNKVGASTPATLINGYHREDVTMNGQVAYGTGDRLFILNVVGASTPARLVNPHQ